MSIVNIRAVGYSFPATFINKYEADRFILKLVEEFVSQGYRDTSDDLDRYIMVNDEHKSSVELHVEA